MLKIDSGLTRRSRPNMMGIRTEDAIGVMMEQAIFEDAVCLHVLKQQSQPSPFLKADMSSRVPLLFSKSSIFLSRWSHLRFKHALRRRPVRVLTSFDEKKAPSLNQVTDLVKRKDKLPTSKKQDIKIPIPPYVKLVEADKRYAKIFSMVKSQKPGENEDKILLEGVRVINDAIEAGVKLEMLFFSKEEVLGKIKFRKPERIELYKVLHKTMQLWSSLDRCPGIMGVFKKPMLSDLKVVSEPVIPVTVLGYNIHSHKVLGSIIRNAASAGCKSVLLTKGCTNAWTPKMIRASSGAHFHIPVIEEIDWCHVLNYIASDASVYIIDSRAEVYEEVYESLLDAVGGTQSDDDEIREGEEVEDGELDRKTLYVTRKDNNQQLIVDEGYKDKDDLSKYDPDSLRTVRYPNVSFPSKEIVICVSEQNFCEDPCAMKLGHDFGGVWLNIPSKNRICKISSSLALPVILYEIKRQLGEEYVTI